MPRADGILLNMPTTPRPPASPAVARRSMHIVVLLLLALGACASPSPTPTPSPSPSQSPTASPTVGPTASPTATPEPPLSLALPATRDPRRLRVGVTPSVPSSGVGRLTVTVTNLSTSRIKEIVLRWPSPLDRIVFLSPFRPSAGRLGFALVQPWTKWVVGPGEQGEPAGTTSLGWGPLLPKATLTIPLVATRKAAGAVSFDLQLLAGEALLAIQSGGPAETRVTIP
jgi:hypothetical protein